MERAKDLIGKIQKEVYSGNVNSKFRATDFKFLKPSSRNFLWKHSNQNKKLKGNIYFLRLERGLYQLK